MKTTTTARGQYERSTENASDSTGTATTVTQTSIKAQVDSLFHALLKQTSAHEGEASVEQTLHLWLFDTTQPADTCTGLPPVKAAFMARTSTKARGAARSTVQADVTSALTKTAEDSTHAVTESTAHVQRNQQTSERGKHSTTDKVKTQRSSWRSWLTIMLALWVAVLGCIIYLRRK